MKGFVDKKKDFCDLERLKKTNLSIHSLFVGGKKNLRQKCCSDNTSNSSQKILPLLF
jgi:hypothetical protein